jgi:preprotein translocase subunit SecF
MAILQQGGLNVEKRREDHVGPQIGNELRDQGGIAMLVSLTAMMIYISLRFQLKFSIGATIATFHDIIVTLGCFSLFQWEFDLNSLAAVLTILGYTLHDKVVVGDRIRENFRKVRSGTTIQIINASLNETLGRTIITSGVTLLSVLGLFFFGGELLHGFSMAMIIGIVVGTYSSIYISANILVILKLTKKDMVLPVHEKGGTYDDGMP